MNTGSNFDYSFRVILVGNAASGKSTMLMRYAENEYKNNYQATIGIDFKVKTLMADGKTVKLQIWDTAGQEAFRTVTCSYYKGASGVVVCYDVTDRSTFNALDGWFEEMEKYCSQNVSKILVGTKIDMGESSRQVSYEEGAEVAKKLGIKFYESSSKDNININEAFDQITREMLSKVKATPKNSNEGQKDKVRLNSQKNGGSKNSGGCC